MIRREIIDGVLAAFMAVALLSLGTAQNQLHVADLIKKHLDSIGTGQARAAVRNRVVEGTVKWKQLNRGKQKGGKQVMVSEGNKLVCLLKVRDPDYHGERFVSDGSETFVADLTPGVLSVLGEFVYTNPEILTEGLLGGTLSTAWPLAHLDERKAKLQDQGLKIVDGRELHRIDYVPEKYSALSIQLYFDPNTFRHVMTVYLLQSGMPFKRYHWLARNYRLEERFADFKSVDNLTLPERWTIEFSMGSITQFEVTETSVSHNTQLDQNNFNVKWRSWPSDP